MNEPYITEQMSKMEAVKRFLNGEFAIWCPSCSVAKEVLHLCSTYGKGFRYPFDIREAVEGVTLFYEVPYGYVTHDTESALDDPGPGDLPKYPFVYLGDGCDVEYFEQEIVFTC